MAEHSPPGRVTALIRRRNGQVWVAVAALTFSGAVALGGPPPPALPPPCEPWRGGFGCAWRFPRSGRRRRAGLTRRPCRPWVALATVPGALGRFLGLGSKLWRRPSEGAGVVGGDLDRALAAALGLGAECV